LSNKKQIRFPRGKFKLIDASAKSLKFELKGKVLKGIYILVQFTKEKKNW